MSKVQFLSDYISLATPYDPDFNRAIRQIHGSHFIHHLGAWLVPSDRAQEVRELARAHFGFDGTIRDQVQLRITLNPGAEITSARQLLSFDRWPVVYIRQYKARVSELVAFENVTASAKKISVGDWRAELKVSPAKPGTMIIAGIGRARAEAAWERYAAGELDPIWTGAIKFLDIEKFSG